MNCYHGWKFMLLLITLWLAFAVASPAQTCPVACADLPPCMMDGNTCDVTVNSDGTAGSVCVTLSDQVTSIEWVPSSSGPSGCTINFNTANGNPLGTSTAACGSSYPIVSGGAPNSQHCYGYSITTIVNPPAGKGDPLVVVQCNNGATNCATGNAEKKHK